MALYSSGSWVFVPDNDDVFVPMKVSKTFRESERAFLLLADGVSLSVDEDKSSKVLRMDCQSLETIEDMVELKILNSASLLHNIRLRFQSNMIYTYVDSILISVNPFKILPLFTQEIIEQYRINGYRRMPPHIYGVADNLYGQMLSNHRNQSCIVSGESGAGKTEATKIFMQYITEISKNTAYSKDNERNSLESSLEQQILTSNQLMEMFGNSKTSRNSNSSRFGKLIEMKFNSNTGKLVGGNVLQYLFEKNRVVSHGKDERNYHIFYSICAHAALYPEFQKKFGLLKAEDYHYLNKSGVITVDNISDDLNFQVFVDAMKTMGVSSSDQSNLFRVVSGILHLGNIEFEGTTSNHVSGSRVLNCDVLEKTASDFAVELHELEMALCFQKLSTKNDTLKKALDVKKAIEIRDSLASELYSKLFNWIISSINQSMYNEVVELSPSCTIRTISVVDIFGFEVFETNSFEQLCINYCNEKLQLQFNTSIFTMEETEYQSENVFVSHVDFENNHITVNLFERKYTGLFAILDEEMALPGGNDAGFLKRLTIKNSKHPKYKGPGYKEIRDHKSFTIEHFAGPVEYYVPGFVEKNRHKITEDILKLFHGSKIEFVSALVDSQAQGNARKRNQSLGSKFKDQLNSLMCKLDGTSPAFVRCIKPNTNSTGGLFSSPIVFDQLRYLGLLELCRIRKNGYSVRKTFNEFFVRYRPLGFKAKNGDDLCKELESKNILTRGEFQFGKTKIFLRTAMHNHLECELDAARSSFAIKLQRAVRRYLYRLHYLRYLDILHHVRDAVQSQDYDELKEAMEAIETIPKQGFGLVIIQRSLEILKRSKVELDTKKGLVHAIDSRDKESLRISLTTAKNLALQNCGEIDSAKMLLEQLDAEKIILGELRIAIDKRDFELLVEALSVAKNFGISKDDSTFVEGNALMTAMEDEREARMLSRSTATTKGLENFGLEKIAISSEEKVSSDDSFRELPEQDELDEKDSFFKPGLQLPSVYDKLKEFDAKHNLYKRKLTSKFNSESFSDDPLELLSLSDMGGENDQNYMNMTKVTEKRFNLLNFPLIRTNADFLKGVSLNKNRVVANMLCCQKTALHRSLLKLDKDLNKIAIAINRSILRYCGGGQSVKHSAPFALEIVTNGRQFPGIADEIYMQLCKQMIKNSDIHSLVRSWQLMCISVEAFPPSSGFQFFLLNFLFTQVAIVGMMQTYARYAIRRLRGTLLADPNTSLPSINEIYAYSKFPPAIANVKLVDGTPIIQCLPISPSLRVIDVLKMCIKFLSLEDTRSDSFGLFAEEVIDSTSSFEEVTSDTRRISSVMVTSANLWRISSRNLCNGYFMADVISQLSRQNPKRIFAFTFKRKLFLPGMDAPGKDPIFKRIVYIQATDDVISGRFPISGVSDATILTATAFFADVEELPKTEESLLEDDVMSYVPVAFRETFDKSKWLTEVLAMRSSLEGKSPQELENSYLDKLSDLPLWGSTLFHVRKEAFGMDMICAIFYNKIIVLNSFCEPLETHEFKDAIRWGDTTKTFWMVLHVNGTHRNTKVELCTAQGREMSTLIMDYVTCPDLKHNSKNYQLEVML